MPGQFDAGATDGNLPSEKIDVADPNGGEFPGSESCHSSQVDQRCVSRLNGLNEVIDLTNVEISVRRRFNRGEIRNVRSGIAGDVSILDCLFEHGGEKLMSFDDGGRTLGVR